jgi:hypothetical protein
MLAVKILLKVFVLVVIFGLLLQLINPNSTVELMMSIIFLIASYLLVKNELKKQKEKTI